MDSRQKNEIYSWILTFRSRRLDICHSTQSHWNVARCRKLYNPLQQQLVLSWRLLSWSCFVAAGSCSFATFCHNIPRKSWWCPEMSLVTGATMGIPEVPGEELHAVPLSQPNHPRGDAGCNANLCPAKKVKHSETFKHSEPHKTPARLPWDSHYSRVNIERPDWKRRKLIGADLRVFWEYSDWLWCGWDWLTKSLCETPNISDCNQFQVWNLKPLSTPLVTTRRFDVL